MKRILGGFLVLILTMPYSQGAAGWQKFVAPNGSFSLHHPAGWTAAMQGTVVVIKNNKTDEDLLFLGLPRARSARTAAEIFIGELRKNNPDLTASDWNVQNSETGELTTFQMSFSNENRKMSALGLVLQDTRQGTWLSYSCPVNRFNKDQGAKLISQVFGSIASGTSSPPPSVPYKAASPVSASIKTASGSTRTEGNSIKKNDRAGLVGSWTTNPQGFGELVDVNTGASRGPSYFIQVLIFRADGSYETRASGAGTVLSANVVQTGRWQVKDNLVVITDVKEKRMGSSDSGKPLRDQGYLFAIVNDEKGRKLKWRELYNFPERETYPPGPVKDWDSYYPVGATTTTK